MYPSVISIVTPPQKSVTMVPARGIRNACAALADCPSAEGVLKPTTKEENKTMVTAVELTCSPKRDTIVNKFIIR
jgi:hypothetical protein